MPPIPFHLEKIRIRKDSLHFILYIDYSISLRATKVKKNPLPVPYYKSISYESDQAKKMTLQTLYTETDEIKKNGIIHYRVIPFLIKSTQF